MNRTVTMAFILGTVFFCDAKLGAQNNSLLGPFDQMPDSTSLQGMSWGYVQPPLPRSIVKNDIVMVTVNELSQVTSEGDLQRRKNALYDAVLNDWVILDAFRAIRPAPQTSGDPRIQGQINQLFRAQGEMETREQITLSVAARVVDLRPNGQLVLEAHKTVRNNNEVWEVSLSGVCRAEDVNENNMILSERIYGLEIYKREMGHVRDSYRRGAVSRFLDRLSPF